MTDNGPNFFASRYGLLLTQISCYQCKSTTPAAAVWTGDFQEHEDGEVLDAGEAALLSYVRWLDETATALVRAHAPWMHLAATQMSGVAYWANHCQACGAIQGDHFVRQVDGPYWPTNDAALSTLKFVPGAGSLRAVASTSQSSWMRQVEDACRRT